MPMQLRGLAKLNRLEDDSQGVLWIRDATYEEQLYVSPLYERVWGYSCLSLYDNPASWYTYLVNTSENEVAGFATRNSPINPNHTKIYTFCAKDGTIRMMQDRSLRLFFGKAPNDFYTMGASLEISQSVLDDPAKRRQASEKLDMTLVQFSRIVRELLGIKNVDPKAPSFLEHLSQREIEVLRALLQGKTSREIGKLLFISPRTVEDHIRNIKGKTLADSKSHLIVKCIEENILDIKI
jgi:DNA-binding CsgD family transcriptional regulator